MTHQRTEASLRFEGGADERPWAYRAEQFFCLQNGVILHRLSLENRDSRPLPAFLGLHPYFRDSPGAQLEAQLQGVWRTDERSLPVALEAVPRDWSFNLPRSVRTQPLDHCFTGWEGTASIAWETHVVRLHSTGCQCLHVYVPPHAAYFCLEPQTAAAGALGRGGAELRVLEPAERCEIELRPTLQSRPSPRQEGPWKH